MSLVYYCFFSISILDHEHKSISGLDRMACQHGYIHRSQTPSQESTSQNQLPLKEELKYVLEILPNETEEILITT